MPETAFTRDELLQALHVEHVKAIRRVVELKRELRVRATELVDLELGLRSIENSREYLLAELNGHFGMRLRIVR